jgi:glycosyltransferase involved in cell wall biosynthesis
MNVAIILPRIAQLGPVMVIQNLVNSLIKYDDLNIRVFYLDKKVDPEVKMDVKPEKLIWNRFRFSDFDIIHTNGIRPDLFAYLNRRKIKYHISTIHSFVFTDLKFSYNRFVSSVFGNVWLLLWKRSDKLVCVSNALKKEYCKYLPESKIRVIYNGIAESSETGNTDKDIIRQIESFRSRGLKVIGCSCILTRIKGIDQVLSMIATEKDFAVIIIGNGKDYTKLVSLSMELNISGRVMFCGFRRNAVRYFRYFDCFLMPSRSEGFGLALIEAVQQKVPVVCSDVEVFHELFNNDEVTFFELENINSLCNALRTAIQTRRKKTVLAFSKYSNKYTEYLMAEGYYKLYKSILQYG